MDEAAGCFDICEACSYWSNIEVIFQAEKSAEIDDRKKVGEMRLKIFYPMKKIHAKLIRFDGKAEGLKNEMKNQF